jgi:HSP20 family protein
VRGRADNPLRRLGDLRDMVLETLATDRRRRPARAEAWQPPLDLAATEGEYVMLLDLPGVPREQIEATVHEGVLRVRGSSQPPEGLAGARAVRRERPLGQFVRSVHLPTDADLTSVSARLADGVLELRVARRRPESSRIEIEIGQ